MGEYSTRPKNQYMEVFAETFTKFICDALSGDKLIKNPIELFKNSPKEFQTIVRKTIDLEI